MGMASSQARLLHLTTRMHQIEYNAARIEAQKLQLANQSRQVYQNYLEALEAKKIQFRAMNPDASITFNDATLAILENGAVETYDGITMAKTFLVQNAGTGEIYVTPEFAAKYGLDAAEDVDAPKTLKEFLEANEAETQPVMAPDYTDIIRDSLIPVENIPGTDTYKVTSNSINFEPLTTYSMNEINNPVPITLGEKNYVSAPSDAITSSADISDSVNRTVYTINNNNTYTYHPITEIKYTFTNEEMNYNIIDMYLANCQNTGESPYIDAGLSNNGWYKADGTEWVEGQDSEDEKDYNTTTYSKLHDFMNYVGPNSTTSIDPRNANQPASAASDGGDWWSQFANKLINSSLWNTLIDAHGTAAGIKTKGSFIYIRKNNDGTQTIYDNPTENAIKVKVVEEEQVREMMNYLIENNLYEQYRERINGDGTENNKGIGVNTITSFLNGKAQLMDPEHTLSISDNGQSTTITCTGGNIIYFGNSSTSTGMYTQAPNWFNSHADIAGVSCSEQAGLTLNQLLNTKITDLMYTTENLPQDDYRYLISNTNNIFAGLHGSRKSNYRLGDSITYYNKNLIKEDSPIFSYGERSFNLSKATYLDTIKMLQAVSQAKNEDGSYYDLLKPFEFSYNPEGNGNISFTYDNGENNSFSFLTTLTKKYSTSEDSTATRSYQKDFTIDTNQLAKEIYLAQSIVDKATADEYNDNASRIGVISLNIHQYLGITGDDKDLQLARYAAELEDALRNGKDLTRLVRVPNCDYTYTPSGDFATLYSDTTDNYGNVISYNITTNTLGRDWTPINCSTTNVTLLNNYLSDEDMKKFIAMKQAQTDNPTGEDYQNKYNALAGKNSLELTRMYYALQPNSSTLSGESELGEQYNYEDGATTIYNIIPNDKNVKGPSREDMIQYLAYNASTADKSIDGINNYIAQINNQGYSDIELASLVKTMQTNGASRNNIITAIQNNTKVSDNILKENYYDNQTGWYEYHVRECQDSEGEYKFEEDNNLITPSVQDIAYELMYAAKHEADPEIQNIEKVQDIVNLINEKLIRTGNYTYLAKISEMLNKYLNGSNDVDGAAIRSIMANLTRNMPPQHSTYQYDSKVYDNNHIKISTNVVNKNIQYGEKETGEIEFVKNERYYELVDQWNEIEKLRNMKYVIVDDEFAQSTKFLSNLLTQNECILIEFTDGDKELRDTNVSVETSLREVDDEKELKKAEAQYEADMRRIDMKERRYDTELAGLDAERNAVKNEMETLKTVAKDNVDRTFKLFS